MSEQKPDTNLVKFGKLITVCVTCIAIIYGVVTLVGYLSS